MARCVSSLLSDAEALREVGASEQAGIDNLDVCAPADAERDGLGDVAPPNAPADAGRRMFAEQQPAIGHKFEDLSQGTATKIRCFALH
jgi:hypothetical protein